MPPTTADLEKLRSVFIAPWRFYLLTADHIPFTDEMIDEDGVPVDSTPIALHKKAPARVSVRWQIEKYTNAGEPCPVLSFLNVGDMQISVPAASIGDVDGHAYRDLVGCGLIDSTGVIGKPDLTALTPIPVCLVGKNRNPLAEKPLLIAVMYGGVCSGFEFEMEHDLFSGSTKTLEGQYHSQAKRQYGIGRIFPL